jgi:plastocyanin
MELISVARRGELIGSARNVRKVELRDIYAVDRELFAAWQAGDFDAVARAARASRDKVAARVAAGMSLRRVKVVSVPLSEYQRFAFDYSAHAVDAGEDIRWVPRRLVSTVLLPGNDFFVLDDDFVIFNVLDGANDRAEQQLYRDADVVKLCRDSFDAAWEVSIPHREYHVR